MATIKIPVIVQSCKTCEKKLLKGNYDGKIGSPLITCKHCTTTQVTPLRTEWYDYPAKWLVWLWPVILPVIGLIAGLFMEGILIGLIVAIIFLIVGLCISSVNLVRMLLSIRRMRSIAYLDKLLEYNLITRTEYETFRQKAK